MNLATAPTTTMNSGPRAETAVRARTKKNKIDLSSQHDMDKNDYEIRSVINALDLLEAICKDAVLDPDSKDAEVRVTRLSRQLGLTKSAVFRLLATFERRGYVEHIENKGVYRIGMNAFEVGLKLLSRMGLLQQCRPVIEELSRRCNEAVYLAIRRGSEFLFIDLVESAQQVKIASLVGKRFALESSAPGQVILAYSESIGPLTSEAAANRQQEIRRQGHCYEQGGLGEMVGCLAFPFFDNLGAVAGSLCLVSPTFRLTQDRLETSFIPNLKEASATISSKLGYMKPYTGGIRL